MRRITIFAVVLLPLILLPAAAYAQASIAGQVRDASGAVLPGVTVEASSPALIEKVRSVVTDGTGQYRIEILPPGTYVVTFALAGFSTVKREGVQLTGTFTATIDAELRVGAVEETITVTGESPIVDVQSATRQRVIDRELIDVLPTGRSPFAQIALIPGVTVNAANQDVGGATQLSGAITMQVHGTTAQSQLLMENGLSTAALISPANSQITFNMAASQEIAVDYSGTGADTNANGVKVNVIPREGGNTFNGVLFVNGTTEGLGGSNFTPRLKNAGLRTPNAIRRMYDVNPGFGGPLRRDRIWFYVSARRAVSSRWMSDVFYDRNFNNPNVWSYEPDLNRPVSNDSDVNDGRLRLTVQTAPRVKVGLLYVQQTARNWPSVLDTTGSPGSTLLAAEAGPYHYFPAERQVTADITSPLTNRLLIDGAVKGTYERAIRDPIPGLNPAMINVTEQSTGRQYRARQFFINRSSTVFFYRAAVSYITGAHAFKVGVDDVLGHTSERDWDLNPVSYRFNNGLPNQITMRAYPIDFVSDVNHQFGAYVQDRWTIDRLTVNAGVRFDWFKNSFPAQTIGPAPLAPARNFRFEDTEGLNLKDLDPKLSAVYDLAGDGKTALKVSLNRYVEQYTVGGLAGQRNPVIRLANTTTRSWNDANRNYVPDCDLVVLTANGECGAVANSRFGTAAPQANLDPDILEGWGRRIYNWEFTAGVQREIVTGLSADLTYFRRTYGNLIITDNRAVTAADFAQFSITAPVDPRLPKGGGYAISGLYDVNPAKFGQTDNILTFAKNFGKEVQMWNGVGVTVSARMPQGIIVQGGLDTGTITQDVCEIRAKVPEYTAADPYSAPVTAAGTITSPMLLAGPTAWHCHTERRQTQVKLLGSYTVPKIELQISSAFQSIPGPEIAAHFTATNAIIAPSLGRNLSGNAANVSVNLVEPGTMYGERLNQLDIRFARAVRVGRTKTTLQLDLYNALNVDAVTGVNNAYASWLRPQAVILGRFAKLGMQLDF
ncbi:MAG: carboxypeptidase regulatory-like domain-containing protein [Acidobacteria bacterium]|nr:carboxypeptidase regulatory-like domain-containing protein [Acidobacteriota bacterium]